MPNKISLGTLFDLELSATPSAFVAFVAMWLVLSTVGVFLIGLPGLESLVGGFICACVHWVSELLHQLGHAGAARRTGYPMRGIRFVHVLGLSQYPKDEPALPGKIHRRRATGGPVVSLVVTIVALLILLIAQNTGGMFFWIALWFLLDNLLFFFLGALLPLPFTDGGTFYRWWGKP